MPEPSSDAREAERGPYACRLCNCHHHTTEQHGDPPTRDFDDDSQWWTDYA